MDGELNRRINTGVKTLLGDPKKAIVKLATPMMIGMLVQSLYNLVDGIWVAGLGPDGLSAIAQVRHFNEHVSTT